MRNKQAVQKNWNRLCNKVGSTFDIWFVWYSAWASKKLKLSLTAYYDGKNGFMCVEEKSSRFN